MSRRPSLKNKNEQLASYRLVFFIGSYKSTFIDENIYGWKKLWIGGVSFDDEFNVLTLIMINLSSNFELDKVSPKTRTPKRPKPSCKLRFIRNTGLFKMIRRI